MNEKETGIIMSPYFEPKPKLSKTLEGLIFAYELLCDLLFLQTDFAA